MLSMILYMLFRAPDYSSATKASLLLTVRVNNEVGLSESRSGSLFL